MFVTVPQWKSQEHFLMSTGLSRPKRALEALSPGPKTLSLKPLRSDQLGCMVGYQLREA